MDLITRLRNAQRDRIDSHNNMSTIAALLSTVTATCLQMTYQQKSGTLGVAVNAFWTSSITFSISCTLWSQLASRWIVSKFHSPNSQWVKPIIGSIPLILLSLSCITFGGGLICLAYTFFPHTAIPPIVITLIAALTTASAAVLFWWFVDSVLLHPYRKHKSLIFGGVSSIRIHRRSRRESDDPVVLLQRRASADDLEKGEAVGLSQSQSSIDLVAQIPPAADVPAPAQYSDAIFRIHSAPTDQAPA